MTWRQAHLKRTALLSITLASVAWGCTESADLLESREQGIIFDVRKTHQSRILLDKASTVSDPDERNRFAQSAFLLTGTARLTYTGVYSKDECNLIGDESVSGSSQLISPTRVVTAHHNISRAQPEEFQLAFDSSPDDGGGWVNDADWNDEEETHFWLTDSSRSAWISGLKTGLQTVNPQPLKYQLDLV